MQYNTKQKDSIRKIIEGFGKKHFKAEDVFEALKAEGAQAGMATVYRHLDRLCESGALNKYADVDGTGACYQSPCLCEHFHLKCTKCGKTEHLECHSLESISSHVLSEHGFSIDKSRTIFWGICKECTQ